MTNCLSASFGMRRRKEDTLLSDGKLESRSICPSVTLNLGRSLARPILLKCPTQSVSSRHQIALSNCAHYK